jgi:hypothetical protein
MWIQKELHQNPPFPQVETKPANLRSSGKSKMRERNLVPGVAAWMI